MPAKKLSGKSGSRSRLLTALIVLAVVGGILFGLYLLFSKSGILTKTVASIPKITKPAPDMARGRQLKVKANEDNIVQISTREKILISLIIPKGALDKDEVIKMIPFYYNSKTSDPSVGVLIGPGTLSFKQPVTLMFDLHESPFKTGAPDYITGDIRFTGPTQVLMIDQKATELVPTLVARDLETNTQLRARILTGGGYVVSFDGREQVRWARHALEKEKVNSLSILEASNVLLSKKENLSKKERSLADATSKRLLSKRDLPAQEYFAAMVTQKLLKDTKTSLIPQAYATETGIGVTDTLCKKPNFLVEHYVSFAYAGKMMGNMEAYQGCMTMARNQAAADAKRLLNSKNATIKEMLVAMANLQFLKMDDMTDLDELLHEKIIVVATKQAEKVAYDIDATTTQRAVELQKLQALGAEGKVADLLEQQVIDDIEKKGEPPPDVQPENYDAETSYDENQILYNQAMTVIGIGFLKMAGFEEFDQASIQKKFDKMREDTIMFAEAMYTACKELGGDNCDETYAEAQRNIEKATEMSYQASSQVGALQSAGYEPPEFNSDSGDYDWQDEDWEAPDEQVDEGDPGDGEQVDDTYESDYNEGYVNSEDITETPAPDDSGSYQVQEEEVQGANSTNYLKIIIDAAKSAFKK